MHSSRAAGLAAGSLLVGFWSCTPLDSGSDSFAASGTAGTAGSTPSAGGGEGNDGGMPFQAGAAAGRPELPAVGGEAGTGSIAQDCPDPATRKERLLADDGELVLAEDTTWTCQENHRLGHDVIVAPGATLTIQAGARVTFDPGVMLLSQRGAQLVASGSAKAPIVFTSSKASGSRAPGDFRGVILIGDGPTHSATSRVFDALNDSRAEYGGGPAGNATGSCGSLRFVRVEFAGGSVNDEASPAGGLTLAGCGSGTTVDHVQIHRGTDGLGLLGGTVKLTHVLVTANALGEAVQWAGGYRGTMQFIVAQSLGASAAMLGSNSASDAEASPVSRPSIFNATLVGTKPIVESDQHFGVALQLGSGIVFKNSIVTGFDVAAFDLRPAQGSIDPQVGPGKNIDISHVLMFNNRAPYTQEAMVLAGMESVRMQDPGLYTAMFPTASMPGMQPNFAPTDPTVNTQPATVPAGFEVTAGYRGAVPQDGVDWTLHWSDYPFD